VYMKKNSGQSSKITNQDIRSFLEEHFGFMNFKDLQAYDHEYCNPEYDQHHEFFLFIWCILTCRLEIAKIFLRLGKVSADLNFDF
jgi:hypothetical protein